MSGDRQGGRYLDTPRISLGRHRGSLEPRRGSREAGQGWPAPKVQGRTERPARPPPCSSGIRATSTPGLGDSLGAHVAARACQYAAEPRPATPRHRRDALGLVTFCTRQTGC